MFNLGRLKPFSDDLLSKLTAFFAELRNDYVE